MTTQANNYVIKSMSRLADDKPVYFIDLDEMTAAWTPVIKDAKVFKTKNDAQQVADKYKRGEVIAL